MIIEWLGQSCFKISGKEASVVTDPYDRSIGLRLPRLSADIVTISHEHKDHNNAEDISGNPFIIRQPGEYEIKNVFVRSLAVYHDNKGGQERGENIIHLINIDDIKIAHLGDLGHLLSDEELEQLGDIDIMMIPVGGGYTLDAKTASRLISDIEPRLVLPMHYKIPGLTAKLDGVKKFCQEMGAKEDNILDKLKIVKRELPQEETEVILLRS